MVRERWNGDREGEEGGNVQRVKGSGMREQEGREIEEWEGQEGEGTKE